MACFCFSCSPLFSADHSTLTAAVCFHNLVTYAQRQQIFIALTCVLNACTHWALVYRLIRRM
jgi:hypothetical protein